MKINRYMCGLMLSVIAPVGLEAEDLQSPKALVSKIQSGLRAYVAATDKGTAYEQLEKTISDPYERLTALLDLQGKGYLGSTLQIFLEVGTTPDQQEYAIERLNVLREYNHKV